MYYFQAGPLARRPRATHQVPETRKIVLSSRYSQNTGGLSVIDPGSPSDAPAPAAHATFRVAAIQYRAVPSRKTQNVECLSGLITVAADRGARIIVLPELCTTGLAMGNAQAAALAETIPGPATDAFARLAQRHRAYLVLGLAESDPATGNYYNAQVIISPEGRIVGKYRKVHLFGPDLDWAQVGDLGYQAVRTGYGKIGMGICCDINYWELMDFLSEGQADLLAFSTNWVGDELPFAYWSEMVAGRNLHLIAANNWGGEGDLLFTGGTAIFAPDSSVLAQADPEVNTVIYADITP
jgi:predicted amidohydrolase